MKFLLVGPDHRRSTDGIIIRGIENILNKIYSNAVFYYLSLEYLDGKDRFLDNMQCRYDIDCIIICGTPWLWDNFQNSKKYKNLIYLLELYTYCSKIVFMGIGSCLNLKDQNTEILKREEEIVAMQQLYSNKLVICRDSFASSILENAQITHHCLPCPAYYCYNTESNHNKNTNVLVWTDPTQTISRENWKDKEKLQKFYDINLSYIKQYKPDIYCAFESDVPQAEMLGFKPKTLKDWKETLTIMTNAKKVLSSRIHCCVPAFVQEAEVGIIPLDTRHYVLSDYGCPLIENNEQINNIKVCKLNYSKYLEKYNKIITKYIE